MKRSSSFIKTERLFLRQIDETDAESIVALRSDEKVYRFFLNPVKLTVEDHRNWYSNNYNNDDGRLDWIAVNDADGHLVGVYGAKMTENREIELSYITAPDMQGRGYAAEAVRAVIEWCKSNWSPCHRFMVNVHKDNGASLSFAESLGFFTDSENSGFIRMILTEEN